MSRPDRISDELLKDLQELAAISLSPQECAALREKLERVVGFLSEIDGLELPAIPDREPVTRLRADTCEASLDPSAVLGNAPRRRGDFFSVPPVLPPSDPQELDEGGQR